MTHLMRRLWWATLPYYGWTAGTREQRREDERYGAIPPPWYAFPLSWLHRLNAWLFFRRRDVFGPRHSRDHLRELADALAPFTAKTSTTAALPPDLVRVLRDPTITIERERVIRLADGRTLWEHLEEWRKAPSNTASGGVLMPSDLPDEAHALSKEDSE